MTHAYLLYCHDLHFNIELVITILHQLRTYSVIVCYLLVLHLSLILFILYKLIEKIKLFPGFPV